MPDNIPSSGRTRTHDQKYQSKKIGNSRGFFALGRDRHTKGKRKSKDAEHPVLDLQQDSKPAVNKKNSRTMYFDYNYPNNKAALGRAVTKKLRADSNDQNYIEQ